MAIEKGRRHGRVALQLHAVLIVGRREFAAVTEDVSRGGMRVRTDSPPPERRLVQLRLLFPGDLTPTTLSGVTVRVVPPGEGRTPGVGIQLYGNSGELTAKWERFVATVPPSSGEGEEPLLASATTVPAEPIRRRFERVRAVLEVHTRSADDLLPFASRDASKGGMFLVADQLREVGEELGIEIVHPVTGERFEVRCVVRRVVREHGMGMGMGVEFLDLDAPRRDELWEFISGGIEEIDDSAIVMIDEEFAELEVEFELDDDEATDVGARVAF
ncbi:hypothetical protein LBMAG42_54150 [Deltaproteobacteria bacterium]|nr:hypothetical protein LBMAG42_54150 [Deltaproteobacteria bacterium]